MEELGRYRIEHTQLAVVANHPGADLQQIRRPHRAADPAGVAARKPQLGRHGPVDLRIAQFRLRRNDFRGSTAERAGHMDRIAPGVHRRATGERVVVADVGELRQGEAQGRFHPLERPQFARGNDLLNAQSQRMVAVMERLHHDPVRLRGEFGDLTGFGGVGGERLFAQHMFSGAQCGSDPPAVQAVRQRNVDRVEVRVGDQRFVAFVHPGDTVLRSKGLCTRGIARRHCGDDDLDVSLGRLDERQRCDARCAQDADPQRGGPVSRHERDASTCPGSVGDT